MAESMGLRKPSGRACTSSITMTELAMLWTLRHLAGLEANRLSKNWTFVVKIMGASQFSVRNFSRDICSSPLSPSPCCSTTTSEWCSRIFSLPKISLKTIAVWVMIEV